MKRLLLTHGYFLGEDPKEQRIMKPYPPLGILLFVFSSEGAWIQSADIYDSTFGSRGKSCFEFWTTNPLA